MKSHNVCNEPRKQYLFCFCFTDLRIQEIFTLVLQLCVEKEIHMHIEIKLEKPPRFEGVQAKHRVSKHLFFESQQGNKQVFLSASFKNSYMYVFQKIMTPRCCKP